mgnify:CR=1 FL=1
MQPIGPLMHEHRLIEKIIPLIEKQLKAVRQKGEVNGRFIEGTVDFFRTYADRTHHGKEEDILFTALREKELSSEGAGIDGRRRTAMTRMDGERAATRRPSEVLSSDPLR